MFWLSTEHFSTLTTDIEVEYLKGHNGLVCLSYEDPLVLFIVILIGTNRLDDIRRTNRLCRTAAPQTSRLEKSRTSEPIDSAELPHLRATRLRNYRPLEPIDSVELPHLRTNRLCRTAAPQSNRLQNSRTSEPTDSAELPHLRANRLQNYRTLEPTDSVELPHLRTNILCRTAAPRNQ